MKTPGCLKDPLLYLRILTTCTVLSTGSLIFNQVNPTSGESTFGSIESLEVRLGELEVKAIGKNTTEVLKNLMKNAVGLEIVPSEERYYPSTRARDESTLKKPDNFSYTLF